MTDTKQDPVLPPPSHRHPMSGEPIWDETAARACYAQARADLIAELLPVAWRYQTPTGWHTTTDAGKALVLRDYHPTEPLAIIPKE